MSPSPPPSHDKSWSELGPGGWAGLIEAVGPASMLVVIESRMGPQLRQRLSAEDVWQETLLHAWRDRENLLFTDVIGFRRWLFGIADHRIHDARDFFAAAKRSGDREESIQRPGAVDASEWEEEPMRTTTPSRLAVQREQAEQMKLALAAVPEDFREVVRLRLFEGQTILEIAAALGIGESAAKHRYRKGAGIYRSHLFRRLGETSGEEP